MRLNRIAIPLAPLAVLLTSCTHGSNVTLAGGPMSGSTYSIAPLAKAAAPNPDPRVGLKAGMPDAGKATWNMRLLSNTPTPAQFAPGGETVNSDLGFLGKYAIQGNFNGWL